MRHILFALALLPAPAEAAAVRVTAPAAVPPLAQLAPLLGAALAAPNPSLPAPLAGSAAALPTAVPASLDAARARVILERAQALPSVARAAALPAGAKAEAPAPDAPAPTKALEAVNSVLKQVSPERLAAMSDSELNAVGGLILDAMNGAAPRADAEAVRVLSEAAEARLKPMAGRPALERSLYKPAKEMHEEEIDVVGLPEGARFGKTDGSEVFRHYTTAEGLSSIMGGGGLWNGFVAYVQRSSGLWRKTFKGLDGVFLTKPDVEGDRVGVPAKDFPHYVDVRVPAGLPLIELEKGRIFLIPLPARTRGWIADYYRKWVKGEDVSPMYQKTVAELDAQGGPGPTLAVPVQVVGSGLAK